MLSILFGLSSALAWGAADFCGGLASRKAKAYQAVMLGEASGLVLLLIAALLSGEPAAPWSSVLLCSIGGAVGTLGLLLFFHAMTKGQMSIAAPVSALTAAVLPVVVGSFLEGFPGALTFGGFAMALVSIWFISQPEGGKQTLRLRLADLGLPLLAGLCFGVYLILIERGSQSNTFWPMVASRQAGTLTMVIYTLVTRQRFLPPRGVWPLILLNGALDVTGNGLYILAGQAGRMDVAAVLAALYPGSTVVLARIFLKEHLSRPQLLGILGALLAIVLMML